MLGARLRFDSQVQRPRLRAQSGFALVDFAVAATLVMAIAFGFATICLIGTSRLWLLRVGRETAACLASIDPETSQSIESRICEARARNTFYIWLPRSLVKFESHLSTRGSSSFVHVRARLELSSMRPELEAVTLRTSVAIPKSGRAL